MSAIAAASVRISTLADGTLRLVVDVEPTHAQAAFSLFGAPGTALAIAALVPEHKRAPEPEPAPIKGGEIARWLGIRCGEPEFQAWAGDRWPRYWESEIGKTPARRAGSVIRAVCCVKSRAEFDNDILAKRRFHKRIRDPWASHQQSRSDE